MLIRKRQVSGNWWRSRALMWVGLARNLRRNWILGIWRRSTPIGPTASEGIQTGSRGFGDLHSRPPVAAWLAGGIVKIAALAIALVTGMSLAGASVTQAPSGCAADGVCLYEDFAFRGQVSLHPPGTPDLGPSRTKVSSVFNNTSHAILLYDSSDFGGSRICLNGNTGIDNLALFGRNGAISSIGHGPTGGCG